MFAGLVFLIQEAFPFDSEQFAVFRSTTQGVGESMFRDYVLPFEAISFLLLAALDRGDRARAQGRGELT